MPDASVYDCQSCGACCAYSRDWPRFSLETDAEIARIPAQYVNDAVGCMLSIDNRCTALAGKLGEHVACQVYEVRPIVCRDCQPGDEECLIARRHFGFSVT